MLTNSGHLTYCTNIHSGEKWEDHFNELQKNFPGIKKELSPDKPMGIGLRLANAASIELIKEKNLSAFKQWLNENDAYVFTMNGFPYGNFHDTRVKDNVHTPDWSTTERLEYTIRLFEILKELLPAGMDGGVSTAPLTYRRWFQQEDAFKNAMKLCTDKVIFVAEHLIQMHQSTGTVFHLDIEPEPDGMLETGAEFIHWFKNDLLPNAREKIATKFNVSVSEAEDLLKAHITLCYDVCHFAIGYEPHEEMIRQTLEAGIKIGKLQISAALKAPMGTEIANRQNIKENFAKYNEPIYLHQVVAKKNNGEVIRYPDLPEALSDADNTDVKEWRAHFHVPVFKEDFGLLKSTQKDIEEVLRLQKDKNFTNHLEVETYTWDVIPASLKLPLQQSVARELQWIVPQL